MPRAVVVHAGRRDQYQVALALHEAGLLEKLVTDFYFPLDQPWFANTFGRLLPSQVLQRRFCPWLPSEKVRSTAAALPAIVATRILGRVNLYPVSDGILGRAARRLARRAGASVFAYSTYASEALKELASRECPRVLFQMHPHPITARRIINEELKAAPLAAASLLREHEMSIPPAVFERLAGEPSLADTIVVASSFCRSSLLENGISPQRVWVVPYGVDSARFPAKSWRQPTHGPLRLVFLGSIIQRKGVAYLLEAMKYLRNEPVELVLCGRIAPDAQLLRHYADCAVEIKLGLSHTQVVQELQSADLFVFPSLLEGFGHAILEAMSCGLAAVTMPNTCVPDVTVEGERGSIVPIRNPVALADRIAWALDHRKRVAEIGREAAAQARRFTWQPFRAGIRQAYVSSACHYSELR